MKKLNEQQFTLYILRATIFVPSDAKLIELAWICISVSGFWNERKKVILHHQFTTESLFLNKTHKEMSNIKNIYAFDRNMSLQASGKFCCPWTLSLDGCREGLNIFFLIWKTEITNCFFFHYLCWNLFRELWKQIDLSH